MSRRVSDPSTLHVPGTSPAPPWTGNPCLDLVHEFNGRLLELLSAAATRQAATQPIPGLLREHLELWLALDGSACKRASRCPFLLVDFRVQDANWWQWAREERSWRARGPARPSLLPRKMAVEVAHDALLIAWHVTRLHGRVAGQLLAMSPQVSDIVAGLGLGQVREIAAHHYREVRPRLEEMPDFWRRLLSAACENDREALFDLQLHGFQMLRADLQIPPSPVAPRSPGPRNR